MRHLLSLLLIITAVPFASAQLRTTDETLRLARSLFPSDTALTLAATPHNGLIHVYDRANDNGWIMLSADHRGQPLLAYANTNSFDIDSASLNFLTAEYASQILSSHPATPESPAQVTPILPMTTSAWCQNKPLNTLIANAEGEGALVGCFATSVAQLIYYYWYPASCAVPAYTDDNGISHPALPPVRFDFSKMKSLYLPSDDPSSDAVIAAATLMRYVAYALRTVFSPDGSSASDDGIESLVTVFGFDDDLHGVNCLNAQTNSIINAINTELDAHRPVLISVGNDNVVGHSFLADGRDAFGLFHANMGWRGLSNCYFSVNATYDPAVESSFYCIVGVMPPDGKRTYRPTLALRSLDLSSDTLRYSIANYSGRDASFDVALAHLTPSGFSVLDNDYSSFSADFPIFSVRSGGFIVSEALLSYSGFGYGRHDFALAYRSHGFRDWTLLTSSSVPASVSVDIPPFVLHVDRLNFHHGRYLDLSITCTRSISSDFDICIARVSPSGTLLGKPLLTLKSNHYTRGAQYSCKNINLSAHPFSKSSPLGIFSRAKGDIWRLCSGASSLPSKK